MLIDKMPFSPAQIKDFIVISEWMTQNEVTPEQLTDAINSRIKFDKCNVCGGIVLTTRLPNDARRNRNGYKLLKQCQNCMNEEFV